MSRYPVVIDGERGAYGVVVPDMPGACCAMGKTVDEALRNAEVALADFIRELDREGEPVPLPSPIEDISLEEREMVAYVTLTLPVAT